MEIIECNVARGYFHAEIAKCKVADADYNVVRGYFHAEIAECKVADADYNAEFSNFHVAGGNFHVADGIFHVTGGIFCYKTGRFHLLSLVLSVFCQDKSHGFQLLEVDMLPNRPGHRSYF